MWQTRSSPFLFPSTGPKFSGVGALPSDATPYLGRLWLETGSSQWPNGRIWESRYIAGDYSGSYINLSTDPCMQLVQWEIRFKVKSASQTDRRIYGEGNSTTDDPFRAIGSGVADGSKLRIYMRDTVSTPRVDITFPTLTPFNGSWNDVVIQRNGSTISASVNGVSESVTGLYALAIPGTTNTSTIGALVRTTTSSDFAGDIAEFKKCDQSTIPLNQSSGSSVVDASGSSVGLLVDPQSKFWKIAWFPRQWL